ncbi:hypothetical protein SAMN04490357_1377 [Streptomyces misionensis]|uniref:Uncharacterized protein n=1 Tax=Streptomyces misionensis TaxID=67331 RepID=A0A1H4QE77_9ACTN|nr:DUF6214 family protein [Streptomyces misionensis]SEC17830.1 hypothetical protein SAMN04490357_1377 [Streptomyces misionensis]
MSVWPAWEVREHDGALSWLHVRLDFPDGAGVDALAVVSGTGCVSVEEVRARPALSLDDLALLADWIEEPLLEAFRAGDRAGDGGQPPGVPRRGARRARPAWPRGTEGRLLLARAYRAAQEAGADPVLALMQATGHSRRRTLGLIARARDAGLLTPRHARR